jgi:hypothetical protein
VERSKVAYQLNAVKDPSGALPRGVGRQHCGRLVKGGLQAPRAQGTLGCGDCHVPQAHPSLAAPILEWLEYSGGTSNLKALERVAGTCRRSPSPLRVAGAWHAFCRRP